MIIYIKSLEDGKLHKGFHYTDSSYNDFGKKKKRSLSINESKYYGLPYRIYSATPNYSLKSHIRNLSLILKIILIYS